MLPGKQYRTDRMFHLKLDKIPMIKICRPDGMIFVSVSRQEISQTTVKINLHIIL